MRHRPQTAMATPQAAGRQPSGTASCHSMWPAHVKHGRARECMAPPREQGADLFESARPVIVQAIAQPHGANETLIVAVQFSMTRVWGSQCIQCQGDYRPHMPASASCYYIGRESSLEIYSAADSHDTAHAATALITTLLQSPAFSKSYHRIGSGDPGSRYCAALRTTAGP